MFKGTLVAVVLLSASLGRAQVSYPPSQGVQGLTGPVGPQGDAGPQGAPGSQGATGPAGTPVVGAPNARTLALATPYQATDPTKPAMVTINLVSSAAISLTGGTTNSAVVMEGASASVASGTGNVVCNYSNTNTGALTIGLGLTTISGTTCTMVLPTGAYFAIRTTSGTVSIASAQDQSVG